MNTIKSTSTSIQNDIHIAPTGSTEKVIDIEKKPITAAASESKRPTVQYYVKFSFTLTYILLLTTATITFIEAIRTPSPAVRHVLNLETCISVVAGYFYSVFTQQIDEYSTKNIPIDWAKISQTRYIDWAITTPMMLLALSLVLAQNSKKVVHFSTISTVVALNYAMLYIGYLGEARVLPRTWAMLGGFVPFAAMFYMIYVAYVKPLYKRSNYVLYGIYLAVWSCYGVVYMLREEYKNIAMNVLDFVAKCLIGLGLWAYYTRIITA